MTRFADHAYRWYPAATATAGLTPIAAAILVWRAAGRIRPLADSTLDGKP